jgi:hypothetical protein
LGPCTSWRASRCWRPDPGPSTLVPGSFWGQRWAACEASVELGLFPWRPWACRSWPALPSRPGPLPVASVAPPPGRGCCPGRAWVPRVPVWRRRLVWRPWRHLPPVGSVVRPPGRGCCPGRVWVPRVPVWRRRLVWRPWRHLPPVGSVVRPPGRGCGPGLAWAAWGSGAELRLPCPDQAGGGDAQPAGLGRAPCRALKRACCWRWSTIGSG